MEEYFTSLSKRQTMLLLTSLAYGSSEAVAAYEHLPVEEEALLKHRALALLQIPKDRRIPVLVQEIKRLVTQRKRQLGGADPERLAAVLKGERAAMTEVVLRALPLELAEAVRERLGRPPPARLARDVRPEVLSILRWKLEDALRRGGPQIGSFRFTDLLTLQQREVFAVADRMGARVLATAVAGLAEPQRAEFLGKLPPDQRSLAARAAEAGLARRLTERDARVVLEMHDALVNPSLGLRSAGVQRLARASVAQSPEFAQQLVERHQGELGRLLQRWVREERQRPVKGDGGRLDIVEQLERLAQKNIVDRPMRLPHPPRGPAPAAPPPPELPQVREPAFVQGLGGPPSPPASPRLAQPSRSAPRSREGVAPGSTPRLVATTASLSRELAAPPEPRPPLPSVSAAPSEPVSARLPQVSARAPRRPTFPSYPGGPPRSAVLRDGKLLDQTPRPEASPLPESARRREGTRPGVTGRSPVLKGTGRGGAE